MNETSKNTAKKKNKEKEAIWYDGSNASALG